MTRERAERFYVYELAIRLNELVMPLTEAARRRGYRRLADQLEGSASSVALNTAEGAAEPLPRSKLRFYEYACRSADESRTALRLCRAYGIAPAAHIAPAERVAGRLGIFLRRLIRSATERAAARPAGPSPE